MILEQRKRGDRKRALLAPIHPVHHVHGSPMIRRGAGELEAHRTQAALERLLAGVHANVIAQSVATDEHLRAQFARMRAMLLMDAHVLVEDELARKLAAACRTGERVLFVVRGHVLLQVAGTDEGGRTQRTGDRSGVSTKKNRFIID